MRVISFLFLFLYCCAVRAQKIIPRFESFSVNEGLSQSSIYAITQDIHGFMWFGSADGLNRYDGSELKIYKVEDNMLEAESNYIRGRLVPDSLGGLWFSNETGIYYYDPMQDKITRVRTFDWNRYKLSCFTGVTLRNGLFWMINTSYGIYSYDIRNGEFTQYSCPAFHPAKRAPNFNAELDRDGNIWFTTRRGEGLTCFDIHHKQFRSFSIPEHFVAIRFGKQQIYHILADKVMIYNYDSSEVRSFTFWVDGHPAKAISSVFEDAFGRLWACAPNEGLLCYDSKTGQTQSFQHHSAKMKSLPVNTIVSHFMDAFNNLWLGTDGAGVACIDLKPPRFNLFPLNEGDYPFLKDYFTKCFYEDRKGRIWAGTHNNGFNIIDPNTLSVTNFDHYGSKKIKAVGSIFCDRDNNMWIGCSTGFLLFDERRASFTEIPIHPAVILGEDYLYVNDIRQMPDGDLVCATQFGLVCITRNAGRYVALSFHGKDDLGSQASSIAVADSETLWMATTYGGLLRIKKSGLKVTVQEKVFHAINIRSVRLDEQEPSILWLSTAKGLIHYDSRTKKMRVYSEKDGMANSFVYGSLEDDSHNLWLSTNGGLSYFDRKHNTFTNYNVHNGLQSNEFNTGAFFKSPEGTFYFGGVKGFNWFRDTIRHPDATMTVLPKVEIITIKINDRLFLPDQAFRKNQSLALPYNQNKLSFSFAALDFTRPKANKVKYILEGWDRVPVVSYTKQVSYPNLPSGNYTLKVWACNADGIWSDGKQIRITIKTPFWKRWWFYGLSATLLLVFAVLLTRYLSGRQLRKKLRELEQQRAIEAERNRISKDMHDEIGSGLTHIALMTELIQTQQKADEELRKEVGNISSSARRLVESMSEIIWALNPQNDSLENLLAYLREQAVHSFEPFDISIHIDFPAHVPDIRLTNEQRRNLFLVAKEALNNALKHSGAKHILFSATWQKDTIHFMIKDDGKGLQQDKARKAGNGLKNMEMRMEDITGFFRMETGTGGTTVYYGFKIAHIRN